MIGCLADYGQLLTDRSNDDAVPVAGLQERRIRQRQVDTTYWRSLAAISLIGLALRLWDLGGISVWGDEIYGAREALNLYRLDIVHSLEGMVGHLAVLLGLLASGADVQSVESSDFGAFRGAGITSSALRLGPAIIGSLTIPMAGVMSRRFLGRRESLVLALLLAISPWHLYWSQGARFYAVQFFFYVIAFLLYFDATEKESLKRLALAMAFFVLAFNAQYTSFVFVFVIAVDWLFGRLTASPPRLSTRALAVIGVALACCVAMPLFLLFEFDSYATAHFDNRGSSPWHIAAAIIALIHPIVVVVAMITASMRGALTDRKRLYLLSGAVLPIVVMSAMSFRSFSGSRYGFVALFPMLALAAAGVVHLYDILAPKINRTAALVPLLLVVVTMLITDVDFYAINRGFRPQWETAAQLVRAQHEPGEKVAVNLHHVGQYLLEDLGDGVVIGADDIVNQEGGVWVIATRDGSNVLLEESAIRPSDLVQTFTTYFVQPRHQVDVWYRPSALDQRSQPPEPGL